MKRSSPSTVAVGPGPAAVGHDDCDLRASGPIGFAVGPALDGILVDGLGSSLSPVFWTSPDPSGALTLAPRTAVVGQPAVLEAVMHNCVDRCTFTWSVDGAFRVTTIDESDDKTRNDLAAIGGGVRFEAVSRISLLLPAGRHIVSVRIGTGDGETDDLRTTVSVVGASVTPPPTSTLDDHQSERSFALFLAGFAILLIAGSLALLGIFDGSERPETTRRRRR